MVILVLYGGDRPGDHPTMAAIYAYTEQTRLSVSEVTETLVKTDAGLATPIALGFIHPQNDSRTAHHSNIT